jgi:hypothetical protein
LSFFHNPAAKTHRKSKLGEGFCNFCQDPLRYPFIRPNSPTIVAANIKRKSVMVELPDIEFKIVRQILQNEIRKFLYADLATSAPTAVTAPFPVADCGNVYRELDGILLAFDIDAIIAELPTGSQSAKAAKLNPCAIGVIACLPTPHAPAGEKFACGVGNATEAGHDRARL